MKVLLLGASGRLGKYITNYLFLNNYQFIAHLRNRNSKFNFDKKIERFYLDFDEYSKININLSQIDLIINCVVETKNENLMEKSNIYFLEKVLNLFTSYSNKKFSIIHFSTVGVYSKKHEKTFDEISTPKASNKYEKTKLVSEKIILSYAEKFTNMSYYIFRLGIVYGPNIDNSVLNGLCLLAKKGFLIGKKNTQCPFIDIREIIQVFELILNNQISKNQLYILTHNYRLIDIFLSLRKKINLKLKIIFLNKFIFYLSFRILSFITTRINLNQYIFFTSEKVFINSKISKYNKQLLRYNLLDFIQNELK